MCKPAKVVAIVLRWRCSVRVEEDETLRMLGKKRPTHSGLRKETAFKRKGEMDGSGDKQ